ncbi:MAG: ABC transporter substrate-binding protein [Candidimonas sp.]|nr:MAG: ABC transporter substrate-binding protein [Candidimonas sp.]
MKHQFLKRSRGVAKALGATLGACVMVSAMVAANAAHAAEKVRLAMPTQSWWPTTVVTAASKLKLFQKEGVDAEITVYKGGGPAFEALAAKAADMTINPAYLVALGRGKGIESKIVATGSTVYGGWYLVVPKNSTVKNVAELAGKKIGITANGSITDFLALWTAHKYNVKFTRIPVGGGGLIPNLTTGNIDAAVVYSPISFQLLSDGSARSLINFGKEVPPDANAAWIATDAMIKSNPKAVQGTLNAIFGAVQYLQTHEAYAVKLIAELNDLPQKVATLEYEHSIMGASKTGEVSPKAVENSIALGKMGGLTKLAPAADTYVTTFKAVPATP